MLPPAPLITSRAEIAALQPDRWVAVEGHLGSWEPAPDSDDAGHGSLALIGGDVLVDSNRLTWNAELQAAAGQRVVVTARIQRYPNEPSRLAYPFDVRPVALRGA